MKKRDVMLEIADAIDGVAENIVNRTETDNAMQEEMENRKNSSSRTWHKVHRG